MANPSGDKLVKIQEMLNKVVKPRPPLETDGKWGKLTSAALLSFQAKAKIRKTGELDTETGAIISRYMKTGKIHKEQPSIYLKIDGTWVGFTAKEYKKAEKNLIRKIRNGPLKEMRNAVIAAEDLWEHFDNQNRDQWFVSWCIEESGGSKLPKYGLILVAKTRLAIIESTLNAGNLAAYHKMMPQAEKDVNQAISRMDSYRKNMINSAGNWVTGLKITKTTSFVIVGVFAAPIAASTLGTGALASAVVGNAAVAFTESAASELGNWKAGQSKWTLSGAIKNTLIDTGVGGIIGVFDKGGKGGKHLFDAVVDRVAKKVATQQGMKYLSKETAKKVVRHSLMEGSKNATSSAIKDAAKMAKNDPKMTIDKFASNVSDNFIKGAALGPLGTVISKYGEGLIPKNVKNQIWELTLKEVAKNSPKGELSLANVSKKALDLGQGLIKAGVNKALDGAVESVISKSSGELKPKTFDKKLQEQLFTPKEMKLYAAIIAKKLGKDILKSQK